MDFEHHNCAGGLSFLSFCLLWAGSCRAVFLSTCSRHGKLFFFWQMTISGWWVILWCAKLFFQGILEIVSLFAQSFMNFIKPDLLILLFNLGNSCAGSGCSEAGFGGRILWCNMSQHLGRRRSLSFLPRCCSESPELPTGRSLSLSLNPKP